MKSNRERILDALPPYLMVKLVTLYCKGDTGDIANKMRPMIPKLEAVAQRELVKDIEGQWMGLLRLVTHWITENIGMPTKETETKRRKKNGKWKTSTRKVRGINSKKAMALIMVWAYNLNEGNAISNYEDYQKEFGIINDIITDHDNTLNDVEYDKSWDSIEKQMSRFHTKMEQWGYV